MINNLIHRYGTKAISLLPPESAHNFTLWLLAQGFIPEFRINPRILENLSTEVFGITFKHPVGLAAGFDKDARALKGLFQLGFSFIEVGTVTPKPQQGNPRPRVFRLSSDRALINRMGFNSRGLDYVCTKLEQWRNRDAHEGEVLGVNVGANRDTSDKIEDYVSGVTRLLGLADYITINISSPNTPGLRDLQEGINLNRLLDALCTVRANNAFVPPLLLKVSPDLDQEGLFNLVQACNESGIKGLVVSNTSTSRQVNLVSRYSNQKGGLSGRPIRELSRQALKSVKKVAPDNLGIISVGGIDGAEEANIRFSSGAQLVQLYTSFIFQGALVIEDILLGLPSKKA